MRRGRGRRLTLAPVVRRRKQEESQGEVEDQLKRDEERRRRGREDLQQFLELTQSDLKHLVSSDPQKQLLRSQGSKVVVEDDGWSPALLLGSEIAAEADRWNPVSTANARIGNPDPLFDQRACSSGSRFWALSGDSDSDEEVPGADVRSPSPESFSHSALGAGFSVQEVRQVEASLASPDVSTKVSVIASPEIVNPKVALARKIVLAVAERHQSKVAPWKGPLPPRHCPQPLTLEDVAVVDRRSFVGKLQSRWQAVRGLPGSSWLTITGF